jgi:hypothetical protein
MTITFRIDDGHNTLAPTPAVITDDQLGSLRDLLAEQAVRLGLTMLIPIHGATGDPAFELEARVCQLALASVSKCFDHDPAVIAVLDEAQFLGRRVRVWQNQRHGDIRIGVASNPDAAPELAVTDDNALALLEGLGLDPESVGLVPMAELRLRLTDPRIRRRLDADPGMAKYVPTLTAMAALKPIRGELHLAWAWPLFHHENDRKGRPA